MTRCIAILTLALTAAVNADQAFAQIQADTEHPNKSLFTPIQIGTKYYALSVLTGSEGGGSNDYLPGEFELSPGDCVSALRDADDLELLVAFVAYEYGTEAACELLLDMGISPVEADDMVFEIDLLLEGMTFQ